MSAPAASSARKWGLGLLALAVLALAVAGAMVFLPIRPPPVEETVPDVVEPEIAEEIGRIIEDEAAPQTRAQAIIDLPGDPVLVRRAQDFSVATTRVRLSDTLGSPEASDLSVFVFTTPLMPTGAELSDALHALSDSVADAPPIDRQAAAAAEAGPEAGAGAAEEASDTDFALVSDDEEAAAVAATMGFGRLDGPDADASELEVRQGGGQSTLRETTTKIAATETIASILARVGYSSASATQVEEAVKLHLSRQSAPPGSTVVARGIRSPAGDYRAMQVSLYEGREYVGTVAWADSGGYEVGAEPDLPPGALEDLGRPVVRPRAYTISDGIVAAGIRNNMSEATIREATQLLSKRIDLKQPIAGTDKLTVMFSDEPRSRDTGTGRIVYLSLTTGKATTQCYVFRTKTSPYQCINDSGVIEGSGFFSPVAGARMTSRFGMRVHPILGIKKLHAGVDWAAEPGTPVMAVADGQVNFVGTLRGFGNHVRIQHGSGKGGGKDRGKDAEKSRDAILDDFVVAGIFAESGNNPNAQNPSSTAGGLGQFIDRTWLIIVRKHAPEVAAGKSDAELLALKKGEATADLQRRMTRAYARDNLNVLAARGVEISTASLYAAHFLGVELAARVLKSPDTVLMSAFMSEKAVAANPRQGAMSVGDFRQWLVLKMGRSVGGFETSYSHLQSFVPKLRVGQRVSKGEVIGYVGSTGLSTGPHLHFQYYRNRLPVDPLHYMDRQTDTLTAADRAGFDAGRREIDLALSSAGVLASPDDGAKPAGDQL